MSEQLTVVVSVDVEEEGLFCGRYRCMGIELNNIRHLVRLKPFFERGIKPCLFCAYPVFTDLESCRILEKILANVEIGAHLHHWNTPPIAQNIPDSGELLSVPARQVPIQCLDAKIEHLMRVAHGFLGEPVTSFRMGRWDLHAAILPLLQKYGILIDASVRPLHSHIHKDQGPDHFDAPSDPYWIPLAAGNLLEVPLTVAPLLAPLSHIPARFGWSRRLRTSLKRWGALALLPANHPLWLMRLTTNLHVNRGGRVISLTWHSSEMMPGGTPHLADKSAVDKFLQKIGLYLDWLDANFKVRYMALSDLYGDSWPVKTGTCVSDWTCSSEERAYA